MAPTLVEMILAFAIFPLVRIRSREHVDIDWLTDIVQVSLCGGPVPRTKDGPTKSRRMDVRWMLHVGSLFHSAASTIHVTFHTCFKSSQEHIPS